jgi:hypothetical protein
MKAAHTRASFSGCWWLESELSFSQIRILTRSISYRPFFYFQIMWKSRRKSSRSNILKLIYDARIIRWRHNAVSSITLFVSLVLRWVPCYPGNCAWIHVCSWGKRYANMLDEAHGRPIGYITRCTQRIVVSSLFFLLPFWLQGVSYYSTIWRQR